VQGRADKGPLSSKQCTAVHWLLFLGTAGTALVVQLHPPGISLTVKLCCEGVLCAAAGSARRPLVLSSIGGCRCAASATEGSYMSSM
jgi:hypothetical protein